MRLNVGAVIVKDKNIIAFGWNGTASGLPNQCELYPTEEVWRACEFESVEVSNFGNIRRVKSSGAYYYPIIQINKKGYAVVKIENRYIPVHRIVANTFIDNPDYEFYNQVNHINGDKLNNNAENLEWCTNRYNCEDRS